MQRTLACLLAMLVLAACGQRGPSAATPTNAPLAETEATSALPAATGTPSAAATVAAATPDMAATPLSAASPTALAEGLTARLSTPDPNPNCPERYPWFFDNPADECAQILLHAWMVMQPFERGLMVWSQEGGQTWVLRDDGSPFKPFAPVRDPLGLALPEPDPAIVPPEGLFQPELGFALYWRGLVPGTDWVREWLGWATAPETAYSAFWQCNTAEGSAARCYFNGPRDEIIVMTTGDVPYWTYVQPAVR